MIEPLCYGLLSPSERNRNTANLKPHFSRFCAAQNGFTVPCFNPTSTSQNQAVQSTRLPFQVRLTLPFVCVNEHHSSVFPDSCDWKQSQRRGIPAFFPTRFKGRPGESSSIRLIPDATFALMLTLCSSSRSACLWSSRTAPNLRKFRDSSLCLFN